MSLSTILVPTDFSEYSRAALVVATALAKAQRSKLLILHVQEDVVPQIGEDVGVFDPDEMFLQRRLHESVPMDPNVDCEHRLVRGSAADQILATAEHHGVQLIVMGSQGRSGLARVLVGSVAKTVMHSAPCPVIAVRLHGLCPNAVLSG